MKPIEGAESEGPLGFFKGVGKGLIGYDHWSFLEVFVDLTRVFQSGYEARCWCSRSGL